VKSLVTGFYLSSGGSVGRILHLVLCQMFFYAKILIEGGSCYAYNKEKEMADRVIHIKNGKIVVEEVNEKPKDIKDIEW